MYSITILVLLIISICNSQDFELSLKELDLEQIVWENEGTLDTVLGITAFAGAVAATKGGIPSLCFDRTGAITSIDYNINAAVRPQLTMEIWIYATIQSGPVTLLTNAPGSLSASDARNQRSINLFDSYFGGIAAGRGGQYDASTVSDPELFEWTQIIVTFDGTNAVIYKNGGIANGGQEQTIAITGTRATGETSVRLNGLATGDRNFFGCVGQVQITNTVISADDIQALYDEFAAATADAAEALLEAAQDLAECIANNQPEWQMSFLSDSLKLVVWENEGTLENRDIFPFTGTVRENIGGLERALCFEEANEITYINYNTNLWLNPQLTMEIWVRPTGTPTGNDWLLGHDDGGFDRAIILSDSRFGGIAAGIGREYASTISALEPDVWAQIIVVYDGIGVTIYKNDGTLDAVNALNGGQRVELLPANQADFGSAETDIGLNGLRNFAAHTFGGCIGQIQITDRALSVIEIYGLFTNFQRFLTEATAEAAEAAAEAAADAATDPAEAAAEALELQQEQAEAAREIAAETLELQQEAAENALELQQEEAERALELQQEEAERVREAAEDAAEAAAEAAQAKVNGDIVDMNSLGESNQDEGGVGDEEKNVDVDVNINLTSSTMRYLTIPLVILVIIVLGIITICWCLDKKNKQAQIGYDANVDI